MTIAEEEHPEQRRDGGPEAHSGGEQLDNVNPTNGREAWTASHIVKGDQSHERNEQGNQKVAPIAHNTSFALRILKKCIRPKKNDVAHERATPLIRCRP